MFLRPSTAWIAGLGLTCVRRALRPCIPFVASSLIVCSQCGQCAPNALTSLWCGAKIATLPPARHARTSCISERDSNTIACEPLTHRVARQNQRASRQQWPPPPHRCASNARRRFRHPRCWNNISVNSMGRSGFVRRGLSLRLAVPLRCVDYQPLESQETWKLSMPHHLPRLKQRQLWQQGRRQRWQRRWE